MTERDDPLRKAAILIDSLDNRSADALLEQMGADHAARVRNAVMHLGAVDTDERQRVVESFMRAGETAAAGDADEAGVEMDESLVEKINSSAAEAECEPEEELAPEPALPFAVLRNAPIETLAECLRGEYPQTIGVVLAHLPARRAAELLDCMPAYIQSDVLRRLACMEETDDAVLGELEQELLAQLDKAASNEPLQCRGFEALAAILDATDGESRQSILTNLEASDRRLVRRLGYPAPTPTRKPTPLEAKPCEVETPPQPGGTVAFGDLMALDDANLARLIRAAKPEVVLLALTGASRQFLARILNRMPPRESRALRQQVANLGPVRLSDMELAQQQMANLALQMADDGLIELPLSRRFMVAA